jgi:hypothetical protein
MIVQELKQARKELKTKLQDVERKMDLILKKIEEKKNELA